MPWSYNATANSYGRPWLSTLAHVASHTLFTTLPILSWLHSAAAFPHVLVAARHARIRRAAGHSGPRAATGCTAASGSATAGALCHLEWV